jgi:hypothetical protein
MVSQNLWPDPKTKRWLDSDATDKHYKIFCGRNKLECLSLSVTFILVKHMWAWLGAYPRDI